MMRENRHIAINGIKTNNFKNISLKIPLHRLTCVSGVSGAGKSSLVFNTLHQEALRRFLSSLPSADRQHLPAPFQPAIDSAINLPPTVAIRQHGHKGDNRSTLGSLTEVADLLRMIYCQASDVYCYRCQQKLTVYDPRQATSKIVRSYDGCIVIVATPLTKDLFANIDLLSQQGFKKRFLTVDNRIINEQPSPDDCLVIARIPINSDNVDRLQEAIVTAYRLGRGQSVLLPTTGNRFSLSANYRCFDCQLEIPTPTPAHFSFHHPLGACPVCKGNGCKTCNGQRLAPKVQAYRLMTKTFSETIALSTSELQRWLEELADSENYQRINSQIYLELSQKLRWIEQLRLEYLTFDRQAPSLSWGELQRARLAWCVGLNLVDTLYCLDEPTCGLHARDSRQLFMLLKGLCDRQNTVVVVEHDPYFIRNADHLLVLGPGAGRDGGNVIYEGCPANYRPPSINKPSRRLDMKGNDLKFIGMTGVRTHNLQGVDVEFPLHRLTCVCGVSGSGKSSLVQHTLYPALLKHLRKKDRGLELALTELRCDGKITDAVLMEQGWGARSKRSTVASFLEIFGVIRELFASLTTARRRGYTKAFFTVNSPQGRCPLCAGSGIIERQLSYLGVVREQCQRCRGERFRDEVLAVKLTGKNINEVLQLTVQEAGTFFSSQQEVTTVLDKATSLGLGYLTLGQEFSCLSTGEVQRLRLTKILLSAQPATVFIFDEPSTGLAVQDIVSFINHIDLLLGNGHTVIVIDHHLRIIDCADWLIELGPQAAQDGGRIMFNGRRQDFISTPTAKLLQHEELA